MTSYDYEADERLTKWIKRSARYAIWENLFGVCFAAVIILSIKHEAKNQALALAGILGVLAITLAYLYVGIIRRSRILNHTVSKVKIDGKLLHLETYGINMLGVPVSSKTLSIHRNKVKTSSGKYPIIDGKNLAPETLKIVYKRNRYLLLKEYFDPSLFKIIISE